MDSKQRTPVIVFAALFGLLFLCLCVVIAGAGVMRAGDAISLASQREEITRPLTLPEVSTTASEQPAAAPTVAPVVIDVPAGVDPEPEILRAVYRKVNPSVVKVVNLTAMTDLGNQSDELLPQGQGSGFVWDASGLIVTNAHVVEGAREVQVVFSDDRTASGEVLGIDGNSDLAVIEIDPSGFDLIPVVRANIDEVQVGDRAIAIGAPFDFAGSMTVGTVSGLGRSIRSLNATYTIPEVIQTDAPINPGNSGGPLLNSKGEVIGINAQIRSDGGVRANSGVGFAIPIYIAERVVPALVENGEYEHPFIGISGRTFSPEWAEALGFPADVKGAYVIATVGNSPAAGADLRGGDRDTDIVLGVNLANGEPEYLQAGGDLIVAINDRPVERFDDLLIYLFRYASPGDTVQLSVLRGDGSEAVIPVELGVRPQQ
jgi:2-alkenal reductase